MSSLYEIYLDGLKRLRGIQPTNDPSGMSSDLTKSTGYGTSIEEIAKKSQYSIGMQRPDTQKSSSPLDPRNYGYTGNIPNRQTVDTGIKKQAMQDPRTAQQRLQQPISYPDQIMTGGQGTQQGDIGFLQKLSNFIGTDYDKAVATWKDKGGFEGLMANPAFTLGLAFMQAGAEGKTIGQGSLDNILKAGAISQQYKNIIKARAGDVVEATEGQMNKIKSILGELGISGPGWRKMLPGNQSASYEQAVEDITLKVESKVKAMKKAAEASGKDIQVGTRLYKKIIQDMIDSGEISKKRVFFRFNIRSSRTKSYGWPNTKR